jgi:aldehyde:ferredoxin oxidoreductase
MPRTKQSLTLAYATIPFGADHESSEHDPSLDPATPEEQKFKINLRSLGLLDSIPSSALPLEKARFFYYTNLIYSVFDTLQICARASKAYFWTDFPRVVEAVTGWKTSLWELMKVGERRLALMRAFNTREGLTTKDDSLPDRVFEPIEGGPTDGQFVRKEEFSRVLQRYYQLAGIDARTGCPTRAKLAELNLDWVADLLDS